MLTGWGMDKEWIHCPPKLEQWRVIFHPANPAHSVVPTNHFDHRAGWREAWAVLGRGRSKESKILDGSASGVARFGAQASPGWCKAVVPITDLRSSDQT
jgi:hypothetical protein